MEKALKSAGQEPVLRHIKTRRTIPDAPGFWIGISTER